MKGPVLWPFGAIVGAGLVLALLGLVTHWLLIVLGALTMLFGVLGWLGEWVRVPAPPSQRTGEPGRRRVLAGMSLGLGALAASVAAIPVLGTLVTPAQRRPRGVWRAVGRVGAFAPGTVSLVTLKNARTREWGGYVQESAAWLRHTEGGEFIAYQVNCTHLGCPVRWESGPGLFFCPCHGGVFDAEGRAVAGPPRIALRRHRTRVVNGEVQLLTEPVPTP